MAASVVRAHPVSRVGPDPLPASRLATHTDPGQLTFTTTADLEAHDEVVGQERAIEAARLATGTRQPGFNLAVLGPDGSGRRSLARRFLEERAAGESVPHDICYVHNFAEPQRPRVLRLPPGVGRRLRDDMQRLVVELGGAIAAAFEADAYRARREALEQALRERREEALKDVTDLGGDGDPHRAGRRPPRS